VSLRDVGRRTRVFVDVHSDVQRARLAPGGPPSSWWIVQGIVHEAALAAGKRTRDGTRGQPTPRKS
jgi:hypothetical protein